MKKVEAQLITSGNQFRFKREHGTDLSILTVKSVITGIIVLCIHVFLTLLKLMIVLITGHCSENYSTDQFTFLLLNAYVLVH